MDTTQLPPPPAPVQTQGNDKLLIILCHVSIFLGVWFILPLIVYLAKRGESELVAAHAREVLNFHLSILLYSICAIPLIFVLIGFPILIALGMMAFVCAVIAAIKASDGGFFFYPLTIRFLG
jgi:uncharacterized Tic20 family protein